MGWFGKFLTSSIGQKVIMSLTGLFLIIFLPVHLAGNLLLLADDGGQSFNVYAKFMTQNPVIKTVSYSLYAFILIHAVQGLMLWSKNRAARGGQKYAVHNVRGTSTNAKLASRMGWIGTIILVFILVHMYQFWLQMKLGALPTVTIEGETMNDLYYIVDKTYQNIGFVIFYVVSMYVVGAHLWHGFQSSFQTLGLNHKKYTPFIQGLGKFYSVIVPLGFAIIPIFFYFGIRF
jgi:succinate dehydrogenase / fumarate reductase cytochrome b subunit